LHNRMYFPCPRCQCCCLCLYLVFLGMLQCPPLSDMSCLHWFHFYNVHACLYSFVLISYKKMPQRWIYIQSLSHSCSVRSLVESGYVYQQADFCTNRKSLRLANVGLCSVQTYIQKSWHLDVLYKNSPLKPRQKGPPVAGFLKVCLREQWLLCRAMSCGQIKSSHVYMCLACHAVLRDTKITVCVNRP
jgi:hypothetical protein